MRNGRAYRRRLWAPVTGVIGGGLLPTPRANSAMTVDLRTQQDRPELQLNLETVMARMLPTPVARDYKGRSQRGDLLPDRFVPTGGGYLSQPVLCRGDDGLSGRVDRLKALGNAVVPQVAAIPLQRVKEIAT